MNYSYSRDRKQTPSHSSTVTNAYGPTTQPNIPSERAGIYTSLPYAQKQLQHSMMITGIPQMNISSFSNNSYHSSNAQNTSHSTANTRQPSAGFKQNVNSPSNTRTDLMNLRIEHPADGVLDDAKQQKTNTSHFKPDTELIAFLRRFSTQLEVQKLQLENSSELQRMAFDDSLERYAFVNAIHKRIKLLVTPLLKEQLDNLPESTFLDNLVPSIVDKIITSSQYAALFKEVKHEAKKAVTAFIDISKQKSGSESFQSHGEESFQRSDCRQSDFSLSANSTSTYDSSNFGSISSGACPGIDELGLILTNLHHSQSLDVRLEAVKRLSSLSVGDLIADEFWQDAKQVLEVGLADVDVEIATTCLKIYARSFKLAPPYMTPEIYLSLLSHTINVFQKHTISMSMHQQYGIVMNGELDLRDARIQFNLKMFRLLKQFMLEMPSFWYRFPENVFKEMMSQTFSLFRTPPYIAKSAASSYSPTNAIYLTPIHYFWLVDPTFDWFDKWTLSHLGKVQVIAAIQRQSVLTDFAAIFVSFILTHSRSSSNMSTVSDSVTQDTHQEDTSILKHGSVSRISKSRLYYGQFVTVTHMLVRICLSSIGRNFFPIKLQHTADIAAVAHHPPSTPTSQVVALLLASETSDPSTSHLIGGPTTLYKYELSIRSLLLLMMRFIFSDDVQPIGDGSLDSLETSPHSQHLPRFMAKLLKDIASSSLTCRQELYKDQLLAQLVKPLQTCSSMLVKSSVASSVFETFNAKVLGLIAIAEVLSDIAATDSGRKFIVRGEVAYQQGHYNLLSTLDDESASKETILSEIARFVITSLDHDVQRYPIGRRVLGAYIFFLRQFYRSYEGLICLERFHLHSILATLQRSTEDRILSEWSTMLIDNLLNFAATPKGVYLLHQSGSMRPCVAHMSQRYQQKLKVSKCERFGYGTLVSQVSTTEQGMKELKDSGLVTSFIHTLWMHLSCEGFGGGDPIAGDAGLFDLEEYEFLKSFYNVAKMFASFPALSQCLYMETHNPRLKQGSTPGPIKDTFSYLFHKIVLMDRDLDPDDWPISLHDAHQIGLRILRVITASLDSTILLETRFKFQEKLLKIQCDESFVQSGFVVEDNSLMRNYVLVSTLSVGGAGERLLPDTTICCPSTDSEQQNLWIGGPQPDSNAAEPSPDFVIPVYDGTEIPKTILPDLKKQEFCNNSDHMMTNISQKLDEIEASEHTLNDDALQTIQTLLVDCLAQSKHGLLPLHIHQRLISLMVCKMLPKVSASDRAKMGWFTAKTGSSKFVGGESEYELTEEEKLGVVICARYAVRVLDIGANLEIMDRITELYSKARSINASIDTNAANVCTAAFKGFDWFLCTLMIIYQMESSQVLQVLDELKQYISTAILWPTYGRHSCLNISQGGMDAMHVIGPTSCHLIETLLEYECPMISSAFTLCGCTPTQITKRWINECFWNILPFEEISTYMTVCVTLGLDYQIYVSMSLMKHNQEKILASARENNLIVTMCDNAVIGSGFRVGHHLGYMEDLKNRYRNLVFREFAQLHR